MILLDSPIVVSFSPTEFQALRMIAARIGEVTAAMDSDEAKADVADFLLHFAQMADNK